MSDDNITHVSFFEACDLIAAVFKKNADVLDEGKQADGYLTSLLFIIQTGDVSSALTRANLTCDAYREFLTNGGSVEEILERLAAREGYAVVPTDDVLKNSTFH